MLETTRNLFNRYLDRQAELNGVSRDVIHDGKKFTIAPSIQQKLNDKTQESSAFLNAINIQLVPELKGEKLGLGVSGPVTSRTNTAAGTARKTKDVATIDADGYELSKTDFDTHLRYNLVDVWAKFPDFQTRLRNQIVERRRLDRIMVGFNGVTAAADTNRVANPLLQDVNIGWLQKYRLFDAGSRVLSEGAKEDGKILIGASAATSDYRNIHALVADAIHGLIPTWARGDSELVVILGEDLLHETFFPLIDANLQPTETIAADLILSAKRVGGKKAVTVPFMPAKSIFITRLDNLSIYEQEGKTRRTIVDNASLDRIETFESTNEGYVVEDYDRGCLIENVEFVA